MRIIIVRDINKKKLIQTGHRFTKKIAVQVIALMIAGVARILATLS